jgi:hypothetical protein
MKIKTPLYLVVIVFLLGFSGCQKNIEQELKVKTQKKVPKTKVKLRWLAQWYSLGKKEAFIREVARDFSFIHQDIEIELEFPYQMAKIKSDLPFVKYVVDTITKMVQQNVWPYDVMLCDGSVYSRVGVNLKRPDWGKEFLVDFKQEAWFVDNHKKSVLDKKGNADVWGGLAPGAYLEGVWNVLYLSTEVEKRLGIQVKRYDMTISDFTSYAKIVYDYNLSHSDKITFMIYPWAYIEQFYYQIVLSALQKDSASNRSEAIDALKQAYQAIEKLAVYKPLERYVKLKNERSLSHDKVLFNFYPSWIGLTWRKNNQVGEKTLEPCEIPSIDNKKATSYSGAYNCVFVVPRNAKNRKEAELFIKYLSSRETAEKFSKYTKSATGLKERMSYNNFGKDNYAKFSQHINKKYQDKLNEVSIGAQLFKTSKVLDYQLVKLMNGEITTDVALKNLMRQIDSK